ncbi:MAG: peptide chain release factor 2 [Hydrogenophilales bacterium]
MNQDLQINLHQLIKDLSNRYQSLRGHFDYDSKVNRLEEINLELQSENIWNDQELFTKLTKKQKKLEDITEKIQKINQSLTDNFELLEISNDDFEMMKSIEIEILETKKIIENLEFLKMFSNPYDSYNCFIDIQSGAGGTEAQDWASMLLRMYLRYCEKKLFSTEIIEQSLGDVAGIKSCSLKIKGNYAYGNLRTETGIHRLVRKSPFNSNAKRHTSFASIFVYPEVDDDIQIDINDSDLRIDTYRASGAGGQHVNRTDSAVRITHIPTNIVAQCQNDRSQHKNKAEALKMLKSKLYEFELRKKNEEKQKLEDSKSDVGWGSQIRSYVLDQSRIKDLRTNFETGNTQSVLDGDLQSFINTSLKFGL